MQAWKVPEGMMMTPTNVIRYLSCKKFARIPKVPIGTRNFISHLLLLLDVDGHMVNCAPAAGGKRFLNSAAPRLPHGGNEVSPVEYSLCILRHGRNATSPSTVAAAARAGAPAPGGQIQSWKMTRSMYELTGQQAEGKRMIGH